MRRPSLATLALACLALPAAHAAPRLPMPAGPAVPLISEAQKEALGLHIGPDSIVDLWNDNGRTWLVFSGSALTPHGIEGGSTFRVAVDPGLTTVTGPLQTIMRAQCRAGRPDGGRACTRFDSDYAGAGVMVPCPQAALYIYHGENHTAPDGRFLQGNEGWTGIGQAVWDAPHHALFQQGQIAGLNASNVWQTTQAGPATAQTNAASGNPSVVPDPSGAYFYLYFGDRSADTSPDMRCDRRTCWAVARAPRAAVCAGQTNGWRVWHNGSFSEPALLPDGTGGAFTPVLNHENGVDNLANVTAAPALHGYLMASILLPGGTIAERFSPDGLAWSAPVTLVQPPEGSKLRYPRILPAGGGFVLTYVVVGPAKWRDMALMRQKLQ